MSKYKFLTMLNTLNSGEKTGFKVYLEHNTRKESKFIQVYNQLYQMSDAERAQLASDLEGNLNNDIFESNQTDEHKRKKSTHKGLLNAFNDLINELRTFLLGDTSGEHEWITQLRWVQTLESRGLNKESSRQLKLLYETVSQSPIKSVEACISAITVAHKYQQYMFAHPFEFDEHQVFATFKLVSDLNTITQWRAQSEIINLANLYSKTEELPLDTTPLDETISFSTDNGYYKLQVVCREIYLMLKYNSIEHYKSAKETFKQHAADLDPADMLRLLQILRNFIARLRRENRDTASLTELFELHKIANNSNLYRTHGALLNGAWGNIIQVAVSARDFDWIEQFCAKNISAFPVKQRKKMRALKDAMVYFEKQEYNLVLKALKKKKYTQGADNIRAKYLIMRSAFETQDLPHLEDVIRSVTRNNNKSEDVNEKATINTAKILRLMMIGRESQAKILRKIDETPLLLARDWLYKKVENYSDKKSQPLPRLGRPPKSKVGA